MSILVLEDEPLIAIDLQAMLLPIDREVVMLRSVQDAMAWLETRTPSLALVDLTLVDGSCEAVVQHLRECGVPIIIHTGRTPEADGFGPAFVGLPVVTKPADGVRLCSIITRELNGGSKSGDISAV